MLRQPGEQKQHFIILWICDYEMWDLEKCKQMEVEVSGHHAQSEHDHSGRPDVEAQLSAEKVRDGAEDKCPQNEPDNGEGKQVRDIVSLKKNILNL